MVRATSATRLKVRLARVKQLLDPDQTRQGDASVAVRTLSALRALYDRASTPATSISIRRGFVSREEGLRGPERVDVPKRERTDPPVALLISPNGVALRTELLLLGWAQLLDPDSRSTFHMEPTSGKDIGLLDIIGTQPDHRPGATSSPNDRQLQARQLKKTLDRLAADDVRLIELPRKSSKSDKYRLIHLMEETGPRAFGSQVGYRPPDQTSGTFNIPIEFFLNGWIYLLTDSEIANWLMLKEFATRPDGGSSVFRKGFTLDGETRDGDFGLSKHVWETHATLEVFGLLQVDTDPGRRPDGTVENKGTRPVLLPHAFTLHEEGFKADAFTAVPAALQDLLFNQLD